MLRPLRISAALVALCCTAGVLSLFVPLDREPFAPAEIASLRIFDANGLLLREILSGEEGRGNWCSIRDISPHVRDAALAAEDERFFLHPGVDPVAVARALWQNVRAGRIISGGSTITMQVIRNVYHPDRTVAGKAREAWYALRLERMMSKEEILLQYLNRVPFGNQTFGIDAAARLYLGKPARQLSIAEAAFLMALPNAPTGNNPYNRFDRARDRQLYVLSRMLRQEFISAEEYGRACREPLVLVPRQAHFKAPHVTAMILNGLSPLQKEAISEIHTTLDFNIQKSVELMLRSHLARLGTHRVNNGAAVVIDNERHAIAALVGSKDFFDSASQGQVNGALALRQPGSTLKPFTYGVALEHGMTTAEILADIPRSSGDKDLDFLPENYDKRYHGPVRLRTALACSYNVPAVRTVEQFGEELLLQKLHAAGFSSLKQPSSFYGVGLTLGNGEVSLLELANAYSMLANEGISSPLRIMDSLQYVPGSRYGDEAVHLTAAGADREVAHRVFSGQIAYLLTDILSDAEARAPAFGIHSSLRLPFPCAAKTGTSKDYKDNWTVGYTPRYTVAVWVGNFDATPMKLVSGITGAAPLFRDIMLFLHQADAVPASFRRPEGLVQKEICPLSGMLVGKACPGEMHELFLHGTEPVHACTFHRKFRLDSRNGGAATKSTPPDAIEERVFEILPPLFHEWADRAGIAQPPVAFSAVLSGTQPPLAISSPVTGDAFKLDPVLRPQYQMIVVESLVSPGIDKVSLWLNGSQLALLQPPYRYRLPLASLRKGRHTLLLKGERNASPVQSESIVVSVQ